MSLKQELKAWEAQFRQENGRDPNKTDIKANLDIGQSLILSLNLE